MNSYQRYRFQRVLNRIWYISEELDRSKKEIDQHVAELRDLLDWDGKEIPPPPPEPTTSVSWISLINKKDED